MRILIGSLKGGVGKTTTAVHIALGLAYSGGRTLLVDADPAQTSALRWSTDAGDEWPSSCVVVAYSGRTLAKRINDLIGDFEHLVIDTGPKNPTELRQGLTVVDTLVVPTSPSMLDLLELKSTFEVAAEMEAVREVDAAVLLTRVRLGTRSLSDARAALDSLELPVLDTQIRLREQFGAAQGTAPTEVELAEYGDLLTELRSP
jgi:chromosome partitioning protein